MSYLVRAEYMCLPNPFMCNTQILLLSNKHIYMIFSQCANKCSFWNSFQVNFSVCIRRKMFWLLPAELLSSIGVFFRALIWSKLAERKVETNGIQRVHYNHIKCQACLISARKHVWRGDGGVGRSQHACMCVAWGRKMWAWEFTLSLYGNASYKWLVLCLYYITII